MARHRGQQPLDMAPRTRQAVLARPLRAGEGTSFAVDYRVERPRRGLYFIAAPRQLWTQSQDQDARFWFPCFDYPAEKQTTSQTIVVPEGLFALGNGALVARTTEAGRTTFRYEQRVPHATYLTTLVVGEFSEIAVTSRSTTSPPPPALRVASFASSRAASKTASAPSATRHA